MRVSSRTNLRGCRWITDRTNTFISRKGHGRLYHISLSSCGNTPVVTAHSVSTTQSKQFSGHFFSAYIGAIALCNVPWWVVISSEGMRAWRKAPSDGDSQLPGECWLCLEEPPRFLSRSTWHLPPKQRKNNRHICHNICWPWNVFTHTYLPVCQRHWLALLQTDQKDIQQWPCSHEWPERRFKHVNIDMKMIVNVCNHHFFNFFFLHCLPLICSYFPGS